MKSFCGVQGRFLQKEPLAAGGKLDIRSIRPGNSPFTQFFMEPAVGHTQCPGGLRFVPLVFFQQTDNKGFFLFLVILLPVSSQSLYSDSFQPVLTWAWQNPQPTGEYLVDAAYGKGRFVAVGSVGTLLTSPNGIHWKACDSLTSENFMGVAYGNSTFVAITEFGAVFTSPHGKHWTMSGYFPSDNFPGSIKFCGNLFIASIQRYASNLAGWDKLDPARPGH